MLLHLYNSYTMQNTSKEVKENVLLVKGPLAGYVWEEIVSGKKQFVYVAKQKYITDLDTYASTSKWYITKQKKYDIRGKSR